MSPDDTIIKRCRTCGEVKPVSHFYMGSNGKPMPDCKICKIERSRKYQLENADKVRVNHQRWREKNAEHYRQYHRDWRARKPELASAITKRYRQTAQGKNSRNIIKARRRARKISGSGSFTLADLAAIRAAQTDAKGRLICWRCNKPIKGTPHLDHWIPLAKGGTNDAGNLHYMHAKCNQTKSAKLPVEIGRLI